MQTAREVMKNDTVES